MIKTLLHNVYRFLTFRKPSVHLRDHAQAYLLFGLLTTWLAGMGRYWDNPRAELWQYLGLGSVAYVFVLAFLLYFILMPLKPKNWSYQNVLLFITLTAPPAILYAIPVERFMSLGAAAATNAWFLGIVAIWRVALYAWFLRVMCGLKGMAHIVALLLPLALIVFALTALNLEHVVFRIMGGIMEDEKTANDMAYTVVLVISFFSFWAFPVLLGLYGWCVYQTKRV
ncbi:hypothetical protein [Marinicella rhabdoformis]|uniref:hypothetical protein n=1 Tax=Marinicella rhabdoformis TaxID=2580566 RepID=UPI0012AEB8CA|nr:hypothetical protein [Marinicella rhabdoformis]